MKFYIIAATFFSLSISTVQALPPAPGSQDAKDLAPYSDYLRGLKSPVGGLCCDLSDCRLTEAKIVGGHWQVYVKKEQFEYGKNEWIDVPEDKILRKTDNPTGLPILCWSPYAGVLCFVAPSGV